MNEPAQEATVVAIENRVTTLMADKLATTSMPIVAQKYLTPNNLLITLTICNVADSAIPRLRVQVFERVDGGVLERSYALFGDRRFEQVDNPMIFGKAPEASTAPRPVDEPTAAQLLDSLQNLTAEEQHLA